ncbi:hypothetical protein RDWZM_001920 [Blomia tropicalis]|uniref:Aquaporin n=1 Tax=Blomia tropicalis TaxID=40697 RepID=A0A9Q0RR73_BLOTA|nr:MIP aquaporin [Blomia tropicalis]KAJ6223375.1 hypothetical protein RDWZM_001920 [Blomia tropicalis]
MTVKLTIEDYIIPYVILLANSIIFYIARIGINHLAPNKVNLLLNEIISTIELCADCAELGVVWEVHGNFGLSIALFLLCVWWSKVFGDAEACPCGPVEECFIIGRSITSDDILHKLIGQLIGAYLTWKYTTSIWCFHLSEQHHSLHTSHCQATLFVSPIYGAAIEGIITFISRIVALESENWNSSISIGANSLVTVLLVLFALNTTGGYFNPIMASALTFGCEGNTMTEHLMVYWIGSLIGGLIARWFHKNFLSSNHHKMD